MMWDQRRSRHHIKPLNVQNVPTLRAMMDVDVAARSEILKECIAVTFSNSSQMPHVCLQIPGTAIDDRSDGERGYHPRHGMFNKKHSQLVTT